MPIPPPSAVDSRSAATGENSPTDSATWIQKTPRTSFDRRSAHRRGSRSHQPPWSRAAACGRLRTSRAQRQYRPQTRNQRREYTNQNRTATGQVIFCHHRDLHRTRLRREPPSGPSRRLTCTTMRSAMFDHPSRERTQFATSCPDA